MPSVPIHPCVVCGVQTKNRKACSKECASKRFAKRKFECLNCSFKHEVYASDERIFCDSSCAATYNNRKRSGFKTIVHKGKKIRIAREEVACLNCGLKAKNKFCSNVCSAAHSRKSKVNLWLSDIGSLDGKNHLSVIARNYLLEEANYKCSKCSWSKVNPYTGKIPLEINHIDGDAHNNSKDNLEVLCPQCHGCTPNHRALNKNSSRTNRNKKK